MTMKKGIFSLLLGGALILGGCSAPATTTQPDPSPSASPATSESPAVSAQPSSTPEGSTQVTYEPFTLTTYQDAEVTFSYVPQRVISTNPNTGEQLMALGLGDVIIGTCYNNAPVAEPYRAVYEAIPALAEKAPTLEVALGAEPDFVYGRSSAFAESALGSHDTMTQYGIPSLSSYESYLVGATIDDLYQDFYNLGRIFQVEDRAQAVVDEMQAAIAAVQDAVADQPVVRVFIYDAATEGGIYTPGNNFASELIRLAGGENVFQHLENTWNTVSPEAMVDADPQVIIINDYAGATLDEKMAEIMENPAFADVTAVKNGAIISITLPEVFASARPHETVATFAQAFHPDVFAE